MPKNEEASVTGKGNEIMLPARGNPFQSSGGQGGDKLSSAERRERQRVDREHDLSHLEPRDLTPEDLAALFPSTHEDREPPAEAGASTVTTETAGAAGEQAASEPKIGPVSHPFAGSTGSAPFGLSPAAAGPAVSSWPPPAKVPFGASAPTAGTGPFGLGPPPSAPAAPSEPEAEARSPTVASIPEPPTPARTSEPPGTGPTAAPRPPKPEASGPAQAPAGPFGMSASPSAPPPPMAPPPTGPALVVKGIQPFALSEGDVVFGMPVTSTAPAPETAAPPSESAPSPASVPARAAPPPAARKVGAAAESDLPVKLGEGKDLDDEKLPEAVQARDEMLKLLVDKDALRGLWKRTEEVERLVVLDKGGSQKFIRHSLDALERARNLLLGGADYFEDAEREISAVEAHVRLKGRQREWARHYGWRLFAFELVCLTLIILLYGLTSRVVPLFVATGVFDNAAAKTLWTTILAGGLGAITGGLYNLYVHVARDQDFDPQHLMWYLTNPVMGVVLGIFVYMIVGAGFLSLISPGAGGGTEIDFRSQMTINLLAWLCGFQQNLAYDLVKKALGMFSPKKEETPPPAPALPPKPGQQ